MTPISIKSPYLSVAAFHPNRESDFWPSFTSSTINGPQLPALRATIRRGYSRAFCNISPPFCSSGFNVGMISSSFFASLRKLVAPPGTIPSSRAALIAQRASSYRSFRSLNSSSVIAPTYITDTPPWSLAILRLILSNSNLGSPASTFNSLRVSSCSTRAFTASAVSFLGEIKHPSLPTSTSSASPRCSIFASWSETPSSVSSPRTLPPVKMAMSSRTLLRISPKAGALTAATLRPAL
mmetsp:Transcript_11653/g.18468  ORF Transcript_11653/g.18468 Transcript_11653/m.18468 type:complete len:238 (-) Transcript_11653:863-1576(-)